MRTSVASAPAGGNAAHTATLLIGRYAQEYYLQKQRKANLTETVAAYEEYLPRYLPLPHPSPRNQSWWKANPWFEAQLLPILRARVAALLAE